MLAKASDKKNGGNTMENTSVVYARIDTDLKVTAGAQLKCIRKEVSLLDLMPARYPLVDWEPWHSMKMHQLPVDNYIVYYLVDDERMEVTVARILYGGRDVEEIAK